jgi:hypothetical protein
MLALLFDRRMMRGVFSGRKLADYFNENSNDWINARKIVNGLEKAGAIANRVTSFMPRSQPDKRTLQDEAFG